MVEEGVGAGVSSKRPPMKGQTGVAEVLVHGVPASQLAGSRSCPEPSGGGGGGVPPAGGGLITVSGSVKAAVIARRGLSTLTNATNVIQGDFRNLDGIH